MKRVLYFALIFIFLFAGCSRSLPSTQTILENILACEKNLPSGDVFLSHAAEGSENFTSDSLLAALYGDGKMPIECGEWVEFAVFLSTASHPCEFAVFLCSSSAGALDTSRMLLRRLDILKTAWSGSEYSDYTENAEVIISGNFCMLIISSDTAEAKRSALSLIK